MLRIPLDLAVAIQSRLALAYQQSDELRLPQVSHHFLWLGLTLSPRPLPFSFLALFCSKYARLPLRLFWQCACLLRPYWRQPHWNLSLMLPWLLLWLLLWMLLWLRP